MNWLIFPLISQSAFSFGPCSNFLLPTQWPPHNSVNDVTYLRCVGDGTLVRLLKTVPFDIKIPSSCFERPFLVKGECQIIACPFDSFQSLNQPWSQMGFLPVVVLIISFVLAPFSLTLLRDSPFVKYYQTSQFLKSRGHARGAGCGWEDALEESLATHFSTVAWRIPMDTGA